MTPVPIAQPIVGEEEIEAVTRVLRSGMLAQGREVAAFEEQFAEYCDVAHAIAVNSGTAALHAALACAGIGPGDQVIVPTFSFIATASSVSLCGATPVFVDVDPGTFNIDPPSVLEAMTDRTRAVIGVHLFGQPFEGDPVAEICENHDVALIEDAAQSHGAEYRSRRVGGLGKAGCFSFYPTKNMTTGEGGMITTDDGTYATAIRRFINHGQSEKYLHMMIGYNYRMNDIGGALGSAQLKKLPEFNRKRAAHALYLDSNLHASGLITPHRTPDSTHVYHQYVIRITPDFPLSRADLIAYLGEQGIGSAVHYPIPIHKQPVYVNDHRSVLCPVAERLCDEVLSLPVHPNVTDSMLAEICTVINGVI